MDGNGRWAKARNKPRVFGHKKGAKSVRLIVEHATRRKVESLTLYAFSSENWKRPEDEIQLLFKLLLITLNSQLADLHKNNIKLCVIGNYHVLPTRLVKKIESAQNLTQNNTGMVLNIAINYGARWEITNAAKRLAVQCVAGEIKAENISEQNVEDALTTSGQAELDLLIRTGGEIRLSNFMLWQAAYAELHFTDTYWPDFNESSLDQAIDWFTKRKRRFGKTDDQIEANG